MKIQQDSFGFLVADVSRLLRRTFAQRLAEGSITLNEARALVYVARHEGDARLRVRGRVVDAAGQRLGEHGRRS